MGFGVECMIRVLAIIHYSQSLFFQIINISNERDVVVSKLSGPVNSSSAVLAV